MYSVFKILLRFSRILFDVTITVFFELLIETSVIEISRRFLNHAKIVPSESLTRFCIKKFFTSFSLESEISCTLEESKMRLQLYRNEVFLDHFWSI